MGQCVLNTWPGCLHPRLSKLTLEYKPCQMRKYIDVGGANAIQFESRLYHEKVHKKRYEMYSNFRDMMNIGYILFLYSHYQY